MILADTSVWVEHLRSGDPLLVEALERNLVFVHPFVLGELACGSFKNRSETLAYLENLPAVPVATHLEALGFMERRRLMGRGIGYTDVHLLASTALAAGVKIWTRDLRLARVAAELELAYEPPIR